MIDPTLRRFLLDNYNAFILRIRAQRASRSTWTDEEHRLMHEALWLLPPDCSWLDVANYIGTKTRTQTLSRALSLRRRYTRSLNAAAHAVLAEIGETAGEVAHDTLPMELLILLRDMTDFFGAVDDDLEPLSP